MWVTNKESKKTSKIIQISQVAAAVCLFGEIENFSVVSCCVKWGAHWKGFVGKHHWELASWKRIPVREEIFYYFLNFCDEAQSKPATRVSTSLYIELGYKKVLHSISSTLQYFMFYADFDTSRDFASALRIALRQSSSLWTQLKLNYPDVNRNRDPKTFM